MTKSKQQLQQDHFLSLNFEEKEQESEYSEDSVNLYEIESLQLKSKQKQCIATSVLLFECVWQALFGCARTHAKAGQQKR